MSSTDAMPTENTVHKATPSSGEASPAPRQRLRALISPADVGQANRGRVLQALFDLGPTSRAELARYVGVHRATITGIVQPLIESGVLVVSDPLPSGGA